MLVLAWTSFVPHNKTLIMKYKQPPLQWITLIKWVDRDDEIIIQEENCGMPTY